jgi:transcriptional regulator with XRE-family HTH domain
MTSPHPRRGDVNALGRVLCDWRQKRAYSPLELALASHVSQRHISFLESGREQPSRDMVLRLATVLDVPLREQEEGVSSLLPSSRLSCLGAERSDKP